MSKLFGESQRQLQRRFDTERLADRIEERLFREKITAEDRAFIERMDMFFLATADAAAPVDRDKSGAPVPNAMADQAETDADVQVTLQVRRALALDDPLASASRNVSISTREGVVTLRYWPLSRWKIWR